MIATKIYHKKTRRGNIVKIIREHYLREDVGCGLVNLCKFCPHQQQLSDGQQQYSVLSAEYLQEPSPTNVVKSPHVLIVDTNVVIHQIDILEDDLFRNVIVPQTVVDEVKHQSAQAYKKLKDVFSNSQKSFYHFYNEFHKDTYVERVRGETSNDRNDKAIRKVAEWYTLHFKASGLNVKCVLLTDDRENAEKAKSENLLTFTTAEYVTGIENRPDLLDKLSSSASNRSDQDVKISKKDKLLFPEHKPLSELKTGLKSGRYFQGSFQVSRDNYLEATVYVESDKHKEIFIQGLLNINRAIHEDLVVVELLPESEWSKPMPLLKLHELENDHGDELAADDDELKICENVEEKSKKTAGKSEKMPSGRIVGVLKRNWRPYCGVLDPSPVEGATRHLFVAAERRIPRIRIETRQADVLTGQRIVVCIDSWPRDSRYPLGHFIKALGTLGDRLTETEVILLEHDIEHSKFSEAVLACLPTMPWTITEQDYQERMDLRDLNICSIDPPGCTDIDDALHCRLLDEDRFEVGIHIADVTHFVKPGTAMDLEASKRGTTVYLVGRRIDMLPDLLSSNLCSLKSNVERFAFSVICELTREGEILSTRCVKSIIRSKFSFTYAEAQMRIDDQRLQDDLTQSLRQLNQLAKQLRVKRKGSGALSLASLEIRFNIDSETHDPIDVEAKQVLETNSLVEEFMLLANTEVAKRIFEEFPDCATLRRHPVPPLSNYSPLIKAAASRGFEVVIDSGLALARSLDEARMPENPYFNTMLRILTTRCMTQAVYFASGTLEKKLFYHFGLATPIYTHFTSPIRRYADILVHRFLAASIGAHDTYPDLLDPKTQENVCRNLNYRHRNAQLAGRASVLANTHLFFKNKREDLEAYILGVRKNALQVLVPKYGLESAVLLKSSRNPFTYDEENGSLTCGSVCLRMFDKITVQLSVDDTDPQHHKLKLQLVQPKVDGFSVEPLFDLGGPDQKSSKLIVEENPRTTTNSVVENLPSAKKLKKI